MATKEDCMKKKKLLTFLVMITVLFSLALLQGCNKSTKVGELTAANFKKVQLGEFEQEYKSNDGKIKYFSNNKGVMIGFAMDSLKEERWKKDKEVFIKKAQELGAEVKISEADGDDSLQISQVESFIAQGVNVLVVVPVNGETTSEIVEKAHKNGVKVLTYDRLIKNSNVDYYISYKSTEIGQMQANALLKQVSEGKVAYIGGSENDNNAVEFRRGAMKVLEPKIEDGSIELVMDEYSADWKPDEAYKNAKKLLSEHKDIDGIICANDGTASGVIQALKEEGLDGKVPVTGQDADLSALQKIVEGKQLMTIYKPVNDIANKAAEMAVAIGKGEKVPTNDIVKNGQAAVYSYLLTPIEVNQSNIIDTVVKDGFQDYGHIYKNIPQSERPKK